MPARNSDGTIRNARTPRKLTMRTVIAGWVEAETIRRKQRGISFEAIAQQITQIGRGQLQSLVLIPEGIVFSKDYSISGRACGMAFKAAMSRQVNLEGAEMRQLDTERYEDLYRALQQGVAEGSAHHVTAAAGLLEKKAKLNGYIAPIKIEGTGKDGAAMIPDEVWRRLQDAE